MTPAEVLAAHHSEWIDGPNYVLVCECGERWAGLPEDYDAEIRLHAAHVLDALTKAGHVVVTLPEHDTHFKLSGAECDPSDGYTAVFIRTPIHFVSGKSLRDLGQPESLRSLAAALLAAAAAEAGGKA